MPRPAAKPELIEAANMQFDKLWQTITAMTEEQQRVPFDFGADFLHKQKEAHWTRDKNLRDVLVHLYEWHRLLLDWVKANRSGEAKPFLPEPYNWKTYAQMNVGFWERHQATPYDRARQLLKESHAQVMALFDTCTNDELFSKGYFSWTGASPLGSYCVSATSSHYDWALKKVKRHASSFGSSQA